MVAMGPTAWQWGQLPGNGANCRAGAAASRSIVPDLIPDLIPALVPDLVPEHWFTWNRIQKAHNIQIQCQTLIWWSLLYEDYNKVLFNFVLRTVCACRDDKYNRKIGRILRIKKFMNVFIQAVFVTQMWLENMTLRQGIKCGWRSQYTVYFRHQHGIARC